jgi:hypothetical protein
MRFTRPFCTSWAIVSMALEFHAMLYENHYQCLENNEANNYIARDIIINCELLFLFFKELKHNKFIDTPFKFS